MRTKEEKDDLQVVRMLYTQNKVTELGYEITSEDETSFTFMFKGHPVVMFPYTGWHTGKSIKDGRGIDRLLKQIS